MMPNITIGSRMMGLVMYLAGPGKANEHTDQRVIASSQIVSVKPGQMLDREAAVRLGDEMSIPAAFHGVGGNGEYVFHMSLSLPPDEGPLTDEKWAQIAAGFMERFEFNGGTRSSVAPCRWVAIHHGTSKGGNDHIHIAASMVAEDGRKWRLRAPDGKPIFRMREESQKVCDELERAHRLRVVRGEYAERGYHPKEREHARVIGAAELARETLQRAVRAASTASLDEAEFVRRLRASGVLVRPRYAKEDTTVIAGYSVALRPGVKGERPVWFGGGRLAKDLTLPRLREGWDVTPATASDALAEWQAAAAGKRLAAPGRETREPTAAEWKEYTAEVGALYERLKTAPLQDHALWAQAARETSGAFAAWSMRTEAVPGPLAETAKALSRTAQLRRFPPRVEHAPMPSAKGAGMLLAQTSVGPSTAAGHALLLAQLRNTMRAIHDMHKASGRLADAERIRAAAMDRLTAVRGDLQTLHTQHQAVQTAPPGGSRRPDAAPRVESEQEKIQRLVGLAFPNTPTRAAGTGTEKAQSVRSTPGRDQEKGRSRGRAGAAEGQEPLKGRSR